MHIDAKLYELIQKIRPAMKHLSEAVEFELADSPLTLAMRAIMEQLLFHQQMTVPDISRLMMAQRQSVQPMMDKLLKMGFVEKKKNPSHKKSWVFQLTESGTDTIQAIKAKEMANLNQIASDYTAEELDVAIAVLSKLNDHFSEFEAWRTQS